MSSAEVRTLLEESGAILRGHFILTSGRHSDTYFEKFRVLEKPTVLSSLCSEIAAHFSTANIDVVAGPTTGGIIIAFEVARQMGLPALYVESEAGHRALRRGASLPQGARVLIVDDVLTTGLSVQEVAEVVRTAQAEVVGVGVLIDRSEQLPDFRVPLHASFRVAAKSYPADQVPAWLQSVPVQKPGTRV